MDKHELHTKLLEKKNIVTNSSTVTLSRIFPTPLIITLTAKLRLFLNNINCHVGSAFVNP
jgi:hypothetical protein